MLSKQQVVTTRAIRKFRRQFASKSKAPKTPASTEPVVPTNTQEPTKEKPAPAPKPPAPRLIFGLGNPGSEFKATRHNIGFLCVDSFAQSLGLEFSKNKYSSDYTEFTHNGVPVYIIKPQTFMNLSGSSVRRWLDATKAPLSNVLVVVDAAELPLGELRIRPKGSSAGQNGLKNIIELVRSEDFPRLRVGIGRPVSKDIDLREYVLGKWSGDEHWPVQHTRQFASMAMKSWLEEGIDKAGTKWNKTYAELKKLLPESAKK